jgi:predicted kinase
MFKHGSVKTCEREGSGNIFNDDRIIILIRGLPGSGKSTLAETFAYRDGQDDIFEADQFFNRPDGTYVFEQDRIKMAHEDCQRRVEDRLKSDDHRMLLKIANTFTQNWEMKPYFELAAKYQCKIHVITCEGDYGNVHGVPEEKVQQMRERWEPLRLEIVYDEDSCLDDDDGYYLKVSERKEGE